MKRSLLSSGLATAILGAAAVALVTSGVPSTTVQAQGKSQFAPGQQSTAPTAVGTWFGIARPCPATGDDADHEAFCQQICNNAPCKTPIGLPPEVPMMPTIHADGTVTVNDAASIPVFHTTAQGAWAADPTGLPQQTGTTRLQASFIWLQGTGGSAWFAHPPYGGTDAAFVGVARPRFVTYWDPKNPDNMIGYIQPHFFPIVGGDGLVTVEENGSKGGLNVTNHYSTSPFGDPLAQLPAGCDSPNCLGTYHFTIHRVKANVPN